MATWGKFELTDSGKNILAQHVANSKVLQITRVAMTDTTDSLVIAGLKKFPGDERFFGITSNTLVDDKTIKVESTVTNVGLSKDYKITAIGLYAKLEDGLDDTLFAVSTSTIAETIPALENGVVKMILEKFYLTFDSVSDISVKIDMDTYVTHSECIATTYPVGTVVQTDGTYEPADKWGGEWEQISGVYLMASGSYNGTACAANKYVGEYSHKMKIEELVSHNHGPGTMNIWGSLPLPTHSGRWDHLVRGAFTTEGGNGGNVTRSVQGADFDESGKWWDITYSEFNANRSWSGRTTSEGKGQPIPLMPRAYVVDVWRRTA